MFYTHTTFIGIDPTAGGRPITYAALDHSLSLLVLGRGDLDEVLAFVAGQPAAFVAVCAPRSPNQGVMERSTERERLSPPPRPGRWRNFRMAEYQLRLRNISIPQTCAEEENCPAWMRKGFALFRRLEGLNYHPYPQDEKTHQSLEVYPHACYAVILGHLPLPKLTLEGRLQRQLALYDYQLDVPDPMLIFEEITRYRILQGVFPLDALYSAAELDALVAAYTAWMAGTKPDQVTLLGHPEEGFLVLPAADLRNRY
jgi:hypothetical protein